MTLHFTLFLSFIIAISASTHLGAVFAPISFSIRDATPPLHIPLPAQNISIPIDHFNASDNRAYYNRFWVNSTFYRPGTGAPVIFYDFGENGVIDSVASVFLQEAYSTTSNVMQIARRFNALVVGW